MIKSIKTTKTKLLKRHGFKKYFLRKLLSRRSNVCITNEEKANKIILFPSKLNDNQNRVRKYWT